MLLNLALNHAVQIETVSESESHSSKATGRNSALNGNLFNLNENIIYNASSPDELALVNGARFLGCTYLGRDNEDNNIFVVAMRQ